VRLEEPVQAMASTIKQNSFQRKIEQGVKCVVAIKADSDGSNAEVDSHHF
jgi:hypothetical protein